MQAMSVFRNWQLKAMQKNLLTIEARCDEHL